MKTNKFDDDIIIADAVRRNPLTHTANKAEIDSVVKDWLTTAPERVKKAKKETGRNQLQPYN